MNLENKISYDKQQYLYDKQQYICDKQQYYYDLHYINYTIMIACLGGICTTISFIKF